MGVSETSQTQKDKHQKKGKYCVFSLAYGKEREVKKRWADTNVVNMCIRYFSCSDQIPDKELYGDAFHSAGGHRSEGGLLTCRLMLAFDSLFMHLCVHICHHIRGQKVMVFTLYLI